MPQPGAIYYLILYGIIILVQFSKTFILVKDQPDNYNWRDYFYVSLQIVYTSAGVAILLLLQLSREWIPVIMIAYVALVFFSSVLDYIGWRFQKNTRVFLHLIIIALVAFTTVFSYERFLPKTASKEDQQQKTVAMVHHYKVAFPYVDLTLSRHLGPGKMLNTQLYFSTNVEGVSRDEAVLKAKEKALSNEHGSIRPFNPSKKGNQIDVRVLNEQAVVEEIAMAPSSGS